jgi:hypothetical protein
MIGYFVPCGNSLEFLGYVTSVKLFSTLFPSGLMCKNYFAVHMIRMYFLYFVLPAQDRGGGDDRKGKSHFL